MRNVCLTWCAAIIATTAILTAVSSEAAYKVDKKFMKDSIGNIRYITSYSDDNIYCLAGGNKVCIFDAKGKKTKEFSLDAKLSITSLAVSPSKELYLLSTQYEEQTITRGNKKHKRNVPVGVTCYIYDVKGKEQKSYPLTGAVMVKAAHIIAGQLVVADYKKRALLFFDDKGTQTKEVKSGFRLCCGIFDFTRGPKDTIIMANLGAFKVVQMSSTGEKQSEFGKRGKGVSDFHGCCNPVAAAALADGTIVTAEKSPTRVKTYDKTTKKATEIAGIGELVKGCSFIPMTVDSKGNIYLAAKGQIIKCVKN